MSGRAPTGNHAAFRGGLSPDIQRLKDNRRLINEPYAVIFFALASHTAGVLWK